MPKKDDGTAWLGMTGGQLILAMWHTFLIVTTGAILTYMAQRNHTAQETTSAKVEASAAKVEEAATKADAASEKADVAVDKATHAVTKNTEAQETVLEAIKKIPDKAADKVAERVKEEKDNGGT